MRTVNARRSQRWWIAFAAVLLLSAAAVIAASNLGSSQRAAAGEAIPPASPTSKNADPLLETPTATEIETLQAAFASGSDAEIRLAVGAQPSQTLTPMFSASVKSMGLHFDRSSLRNIKDGVWEIKATDQSGGIWQVGLVRDSTGKPIVFYAEAGQ